MTIKGNGGIFGRNPTFNNVTVDGTLTVDQIVEKTGAAGITLDGVTLKDGNVVLADGKGIDFSATSGTGTSELFDDYEEGTWTPEITSGATGVTYSMQVGHYTKVGNLVTFSGRITTTAATADANQFRIGGLPFTAANLTFGGAYMTYANSNFQASTTANNPTLVVAQNQSRVDFYDTNGAPTAGTSFPNLAAAIVWFAGHFYTV